MLKPTHNNVKRAINEKEKRLRRQLAKERKKALYEINFNPNINRKQEYIKKLSQQKRLLKQQKVQKIIDQIESESEFTQTGRIISKSDLLNNKSNQFELLSPNFNNDSDFKHPKQKVLEKKDILQNRETIDQIEARLPPDLLKALGKDQTTLAKKSDSISTDSNTSESNEIDSSRLKSKQSNDLNSTLWTEDQMYKYSEFEKLKNKRDAKERDNFFMKQGNVTFTDCGICDLLASRLNEMGFHAPSVIQYLYTRNYYSRNKKNSTFVIGAETGSGKTIAFLAPILDELIEDFVKIGVINVPNDAYASKSKQQNLEQELQTSNIADEIDTNKIENDTNNNNDNKQVSNDKINTNLPDLSKISIDLESRPFLHYPRAVIMEPNPELCNQVRSVISSIVRPFGIRCEAWSEYHKPSNYQFLYDMNTYMHANSSYKDANTLEIFKNKKKAKNIHNNNNSVISYDSAPEILVVTPSVFRHVFDAKYLLRLSFLVFDEADLMLTHRDGKWSHVKHILSGMKRLHKDKLLAKGNQLININNNESSLNQIIASNSAVLNVFHQFKPTTYVFAGATLANKRVKVFLGLHGARSKKQKETPLPDPLMKLFKKAQWIISPNQHRYSPNLKQKWIFIRDIDELQELLLRTLARHPAQNKRYKLLNKPIPVCICI